MVVMYAYRQRPVIIQKGHCVLIHCHFLHFEILDKILLKSCKSGSASTEYNFVHLLQEQQRLQLHTQIY